MLSRLHRRLFVFDKRHDQHPHFWREHIIVLLNGFKTERNMHHRPHHLLPGCAQHPTFACILLRIRPPEVECAGRVRSCVWDCSHRLRYFGKCSVVVKWTSECINDVVRCENHSDLSKWEFVQRGFF